MKSVTLVLLIVTILVLAIAASASAATLALQGETLVVTSTADSGPGTLRQALEDAQSGGTITFDPVVFPPTAPVTIYLTSPLPDIQTGNLTIDASDAGVILDGSSVAGDWEACLKITNLSGNTVRGLQIRNFSGPGIAISGDAQHNVIGGDRSVGAGPSGQGNMLIHNGHGVVLSNAGTTLNTITGNLIGTDVAGTSALGNNTGIWVCEGANGNIIGPDNVIAYNDGTGIEIEGYYSVHNTITRNSVHDNGGKGIRTLWGANTDLLPPTIFDFDLQSGAMTGTVCYHCTVEIFSDASDEGAIYEGQTTADGSGAFVFNKGNAFAGPHLTATATDIEGNTSGFSPPTSSTARSLTLQYGNELTATHFQTRHSRELLDNRIGILSVGSWATDFDQYLYPIGVKRSRVAFNEQEPPVQWDVPEFEIQPEWDAMVTRMAENGIRMKYYLTFWDKETYPNGDGAPCHRFKTEGEIERYLEYVRFIVNHFKDRIEYYELWNEPDIQTSCNQAIELADYINLVERTVPVIREEYPEARISVGAVSGTRYSEAYEYLLGILGSDIMPLVDAVSWHPFYGESPEGEAAYWYAYPSMVQQIQDVASAHDFDGEYQVDELTWWTTGTAPPDQPWECSPTAAAKYASRSIVMHLGRDTATTINRGAGITHYRLCTVMAGAEAGATPVQIQTTVTNTESYAFALPNDDWLVALWTDGIALEYDPGVITTVTLPGMVDHTVTGVDVLHGFEQPIITSEEGGDLVIRDLLVKDYPIILRLSSTRYVFLPFLLTSHPH